MPIPREDLRWSALARELGELTRSAHARNAAVADVSENLWCCGKEIDGTEMPAVDEAFRMALQAASAPLTVGGRVWLVRSAERPFLLAASFAGIYLLLLWFDTAFGAGPIEALVRERLPTIERLTLALPPDDPFDGAAAGAGRA